MDLAIAGFCDKSSPTIVPSVRKCKTLANLSNSVKNQIIYIFCLIFCIDLQRYKFEVHCLICVGHFWMVSSSSSRFEGKYSRKRRLHVLEYEMSNDMAELRSTKFVGENRSVPGEEAS